MTSHLYRLVVVGSGGVGKSCLTIQYVANRFIPDYDPTLEDSYRKQINIEGMGDYVLDIIDTAGQDDFISIRESYYRDGEGFLCVYDISSSPSFSAVEEFYKSIIRTKETDKVPFVFVGNKADLDHRRQVTQDMATALAKTLACQCFETSAKSRTNVDLVFLELVKATIKARGERGEKNPKERGKASKSGDVDGTKGVSGSSSVGRRKPRCTLF